MGGSEAYLENARKYAATAEHILTNTFPLVKDPKLLLSVFNNTFNSYKSLMLCMLLRDAEQGKIPNFDDNDFEEVLELFKARSTRRYSLKHDYGKIVDELYSIMLDHKESPVEFSRHEMYVICSDNYRVKTLTTQGLREYIEKAKVFIDEISTPKAKNG